MSKQTQDKITRLLDLARAMRAKENAAARSGDYLLAIVYNRAHFRAVMLATILNSRDYHGYRYTAINLNEFYAIRMPWTPNSTMRIMLNEMGGRN